MNILLIGDSIRAFYEKEAEAKLGNGYTVYAPKENCRFSAYVLNSLRFWLSEFPTPDIIHFNAGLWDTAILYKEDGCFTKLEEYLDNMKKILRVLKSTGAVIIFATTTPVSDNKHELSGPIPPAHKNTDIIRYNNAILELYKQENIYINDLFSIMYTEKEKYLSDDMIHPNAEGIKLLGDAVASSIKLHTPTSENYIKSNPKKFNFTQKTLQ